LNKIPIEKQPLVTLFLQLCTFQRYISIVGESIRTLPNFPYIFHIKLQFFKILSWSQVISAELISSQTQCNDSTFVDKLFKSVFKSGWCEKHVSKIYLKITTINYISFCFCWWNNYRNRIWPDFKIIFWKTVVLYEIYRENLEVSEYFRPLSIYTFEMYIIEVSNKFLKHVFHITLI
jgi:hypothetical protein